MNPFIGWRWEFVAVGLANIVILCFAYRYRDLFDTKNTSEVQGIRATFGGYLALLRNRRGFRTYFFIFFNGMFHSGIFAWLGLYFIQRYHLGDFGVGMALLGYGLPGMLLGPFVGSIADRRGRHRLIPGGLFLGALCAFSLILNLPLLVAGVAVTILSFGFDMTHPLLVGIVSTLSLRRGLAMGMNAFLLFTGFGLGALVFQLLLAWGLTFALGAFAICELVLAGVASVAFAGETAIQ